MPTPSLQLSPELIAQLQKEIRELNEVYKDLRNILTFALPMPITFDSFLERPIADGTVVTNFYRGVTFKSYSGGDTYARKPQYGAARSGDNVISTIGNLASDCAFSDPDGIRATFQSPHKQVYVWTRAILMPEGYGAPKDTPYLKAYDANDSLIAASYYPLSMMGSGGWQQLICQSASANIAYVEFSCLTNQGGPQAFAYFDDFAFFD